MGQINHRTKSDMPQCTLKIDADLMQQLKDRTPKFMSVTAVANLLIHNALNEVDSPITLKTEPLAQLARERRGLNKEEEERVRALSLEGLPVPPAEQKLVDPALEVHTLLIRDFWKVKKGSKGDRAWKLLMTGCLAIQEKYGDAVLVAQLNEGTNAKWNGISLEKYEQYGLKPSHRPGQATEPPTKHPAYKVFRADDLGPEWGRTQDPEDWPESQTGGKGVLDPAAY